MTTNGPKINLSEVSAHITGHFPLRQIDKAEQEERSSETIYIVGWQCGFEIYSVAVYGEGLNVVDAMEAAEEFEFKAGRTRSSADYCLKIS